MFRSTLGAGGGFVAGVSVRSGLLFGIQEASFDQKVEAGRTSDRSSLGKGRVAAGCRICQLDLLPRWEQQGPFRRVVMN